jgi:hypothetical protein
MLTADSTDWICLKNASTNSFLNLIADFIASKKKKKKKKKKREGFLTIVGLRQNLKKGIKKYLT